MTADGYYVEADPCPGCSGPRREMVGPRLKASEVGEMVCLVCGTDHDADPSREWQERHADLAATLRTILAMCDQPGIVLSSGTHLARRICGVIEGTAP